MPEHILSLSYGKDSLACLGAIEQLGWPLDRIVHAEVWATDTIPADLPPMVEFKVKADKIIRERLGIEVEHIRAKRTYEERFYTVKTKSRPGMIYGWPFSVAGRWCNSDVKMPPLKAIAKGGNIVYIGIAADEPNRFHNLSDTTQSPPCRSRVDRSRLPPVVRGQRPSIAHLHHRNPWRVLVLPQPRRPTVEATAQELPRPMDVDAQMGRR